ncbi:AfsR family transcriptional regulator [Amycolatopsis vastitatis]|uniref:AfsR family transcriptional regulator n=2 Tax=Amycolatopsis vastitatis TaxID=1905142 RepID=A0A229T858_9PSEU|nr:AfsR family transcriptional regulator [Amycolatopsis vastitatis]
MDFRILGALEAWVDGERTNFPGSRHQRVLASLLLTPNSAVPVARLVAAIWDENPPATAVKQVQNCISTLRDKLGADRGVIVTDGRGYRIVIGDEELDASRFQCLVRTAHQLASDGDAAAAVATIRRALRLWRGPALDGLGAHALSGLIAQLDEQRIRAVERCADWHLELGEYEKVIDQLTDLIALHPLRERPHAQLMTALDRVGRQADALTVFHDLRARLVDELGVDPGSELHELHAKILAKIPDSAAPPAIPVSAPGLDAGISSVRSDRAIPHLRTAITRQWTAEAELRSLNRPEPISLTWSSTGRPVSAPAARVFGAVSGDSQQFTFSGSLGDVVTRFRELPARQLVVLGAPGAGKSVLAILLTLGLLNDPRPGEPIPVLSSLASWNPHRQHLHQWLAASLLEAHPGLANEDRYGRDAATQLVLDGAVLPILDGLDEIPPALHAAAIDALDHATAHGRPLVVTCRAEEYENAVKQTGAVLSRAAVIEIDPVEPEAAIAFLTSRTAGGDRRWEAVEEHLRCRPDSALAQALSTPLMVDLAKTAYTSPDTAPADLCDPVRFGEPDTIEDHLLDTYIPTAYAPRPLSPALDPSARSRTYTAAQAERWFTFLAKALHRQRTQDLAWWHLYHAVPRYTAGLYLSILPGLLFLITGWTAAGPGMGLIYGGSFTVAGFIAHRFGRHADPLHVEVHFHHSADRFLLRFATGVMVGVTFGLGWVLPIRFVILLGVVFGTALGVNVWLDVPVNAERVSTPATVLRNDRAATWAHTLSFMVSLGLFCGIAFAFTPGNGFGETLSGRFDPIPALAAGVSTAVLGYFLLKAGGIAYGAAGFVVGGQVFPVAYGSHAVAFGILFGLAAGLTVCVARAWGTYTLTRIWLALRGQLPFHLMYFLEDAHRRGVLRQTGAIYQFRHARLQERLATRNDGKAGVSSVR